MLNKKVRIAFIDLDRTVMFDTGSLGEGARNNPNIEAIEHWAGDDYYASTELESAIRELQKECIVVLSSAREIRRIIDISQLSNHADLISRGCGSALYLSSHSWKGYDPDIRWEHSTQYEHWLTTQKIKSSYTTRMLLRKELQKLVQDHSSWSLTEREYMISLSSSKPQPWDESVLKEVDEIEKRYADYHIVVCRNGSHIEFLDAGLSKAAGFDFLWSGIWEPFGDFTNVELERYIFGDDVNDLAHVRVEGLLTGRIVNPPNLKAFYYPEGSELDRLISEGKIDLGECRSKFVKGLEGVDFFPSAVKYLLDGIRQDKA